LSQARRQASKSKIQECPKGVQTIRDASAAMATAVSWRGLHGSGCVLPRSKSAAILCVEFRDTAAGEMDASQRGTPVRDGLPPTAAPAERLERERESLGAWAEGAKTGRR
jgi:hypothetical protein